MLLLKSTFFASIILLLSSSFLALNSSKINNLTNEKNQFISDTIVVIVKKDYSEIRGILISEHRTKLVVKLGDENVVFFKNEIVGFRFITSDEIKSKTQFESPNYNYTRYCFFPSAFTTKKGESNSYSHYFTTANLKVGLSDNWEFSIGSVFINSGLASVSYSKPIYKSVRAAVSVYGGYVFYFPNNPGDNQRGIGFIPRLSFGDENQNISMGLITTKVSYFNEWIYGSYLGAQQKIKERLTLSGELSGLTVDSHNILLLGDVTLNCTTRRGFEVISFGIIGINTNTQNFVGIPLPNPFIPIPYIGYQRIF